MDNDDFLDEIVRARSVKNPEFPDLVEAARRRRAVQRSFIFTTSRSLRWHSSCPVARPVARFVGRTPDDPRLARP